MLEKLVKVGDFGEFDYIDDEGVSWESPLEYMCIKILPSCGCGNPLSIGKYVKDMLMDYVHQDKDGDDYTCWDKVKYEDLPVMFFLSWADREEYIDHGGTIRCSWMTKKGEELLRDLASVGL